MALPDLNVQAAVDELVAKHRAEIGRLQAIVDDWEATGVKPEDSDLGRMQNKVEVMRDAFDELWTLVNRMPDSTQGKRRSLELIDQHRRT